MTHVPTHGLQLVPEFCHKVLYYGKQSIIPWNVNLCQSSYIAPLRQNCHKMEVPHSCHKLQCNITWSKGVQWQVKYVAALQPELEGLLILYLMCATSNVSCQVEPSSEHGSVWFWWQCWCLCYCGATAGHHSQFPTHFGCVLLKIPQDVHMQVQSGRGGRWPKTLPVTHTSQVHHLEQLMCGRDVPPCWAQSKPVCTQHTTDISSRSTPYRMYAADHRPRPISSVLRVLL